MNENEPALTAPNHPLWDGVIEENGESGDKKNKKETTVSIVLPTYNEALTIQNLIERIDSSINGSKEIIVVDDNSPDGTWEVVGNLNNPNVRVIRRTEERGLVTAIQRGIDEAQGKYVIWMDADGSMPPEVIPQMLTELENHDVVVGSRYAKGGKDERPFIRMASSRIINLVANAILNFKVLDYDSGFVAAKKEVLVDEKLDAKAVYGEYCISFLYNTSKKYRLKEVPYSFVDRRAGESKTAGTLYSLAKFGLIYFKRIVKTRVNA